MKKYFRFELAVIGILVLTQLYWFSRLFDGTDLHFDHSVSVALYEVADSISDGAVVEKKSSNYFFVKANASASNEEIDTLIRHQFSQRDIDMDYEIGIYNAQDDSLIHGKYVTYPSLVPDWEMNKKNDDHIQKNFAVLFPRKASLIAYKGEFWIQLVIFLSLFSTAIFYIYRSNGFRGERPGVEQKMIKLNHSVLDYQNQQLKVKGQTFRLTYKENQLLLLLFENPNQVIEREEFLHKVWEKDGFFVARSMDVFVSRVRKYLKEDSTIKIENLRSIGYRLVVTSRR